MQGQQSILRMQVEHSILRMQIVMQTFPMQARPRSCTLQQHSVHRLPMCIFKVGGEGGIMHIDYAFGIILFGAPLLASCV